VAGRLDPLMAARGLAAGLVAVSASAPFTGPPASLFLGALAGLAVPLGAYLVNEVLRLNDPGGVVSMHGIGGLIGLLAPGIFATGRYGLGWNGVGVDGHLGVAGQGVTGLLAATSFQPDWPGQFVAQLAGVGACVALPALLGLLLFASQRVITRLFFSVEAMSLPDLTPSGTRSEAILHESPSDRVSESEATVSSEEPAADAEDSSSVVDADPETTDT